MRRFRVFAGAAAVLAVALEARPALAQLPESALDRWTAAALAFVREVERGDYASAAARVDSSVPAGALGAEQLGTAWAQLTGQVGALQTLVPARVEAEGSLRAVVLDARFERAPLSIRVVLTDEQRVAGLWFRPPAPTPYTPPPYADTARFQEIEASIGDERAPLPGTLTIPRGVERPPLVVLVHGSGPHDRDETVGPNRPFRDMAWGLASRGIAVLRYEKRTHARPQSLPAAFTVDDEVIDDAVAAASWARARPEVDGARIFVLGHSLGAMLAPEIAERDGELAGIILMAAPARPILDVVADQLRHLASIAETDVERETLAGHLARITAIRSGAGGHEPFLGMPLDYLSDLERRDAVAAARRIDLPMLILHAGRDYQVRDADLARWREALGSGSRATIRVFPSLNHLFMTGEGPSAPAEYFRAGHVAGEVVSETARWILR